MTRIATPAPRRAAALLASVLLTGPALAVSENDRQDTRVNDAAWESRFIGQYGSDGGSCDDPEDVWVLSAFSVDAGPVRCQGLGKMTWSDGGLVVPLSQCPDGTEEVADREIVFTDAGENDLTATTPEGDVSLTRCK